MTAPRWINKLRGLLQRDDNMPPDTTVETSAADGSSEPAPALNASETTTENGAPAPPQATVSAPELPIEAESSPWTPKSTATAPAGSTSSAETPAPAPAPAPSVWTPRPRAPRVDARIVDAHALTAQALELISSIGNQLVMRARQERWKTQVGLDHDTALLLLGYNLIGIATRARHGEAGAQALRLVRGQLKSALLSALRKEYQRSKNDELALGENMVTTVDAWLTAAELLQAELAPRVQDANNGELAPLYAKLKTAFASDLNEEQLQTRFAPLLAQFFGQVRSTIERIPYL